MSTLLFSFLTYCALINLSQGVPIIGPKVREAKPNEYSFVVSIARESSGSTAPFCAGTLISRHHVLTSRHCLLGENPSDLEITIGSIDLRQGKKYKAKSWITYDEWLFRTDDQGLSLNDIAIITLAEKVKGCDVIPVTILPLIPDALFHTQVKIAGWGQYENGVIPMVLQTAVLNVTTNAECKAQVEFAKKTEFEVPDPLFCSMAKPFVLSSCGDSGAPILNSQNQLVGINMGSCPNIENLNYPKEFVNQNQVNLHLHLFFYVEFINDVKKKIG